MKQRIYILAVKIIFISSLIFCMPLIQVTAAGKVFLNVVGLYSETDAGSISYRVGSEPWKVVKVGDKITDNAEITVTVEVDWIEVSPSNNPNAVYEIAGAAKPVIKKVVDLLKEKPKMVNIPKTGDKADTKFANKLVVKQYLGRQVYKKDDNSKWVDIKYGDILESTGNVKIIAINNTLNLILPNNKEVQIIGPIKFKVTQILNGENIYKYLNVAK